MSVKIAHPRPVPPLRKGRLMLVDMVTVEILYLMGVNKEEFLLC